LGSIGFDWSRSIVLRIGFIYSRLGIKGTLRRLQERKASQQGRKCILQKKEKIGLGLYVE
jgi:hypothetical protein